MKQNNASTGVNRSSAYFKKAVQLLQAGHSSAKIVDKLQEEGLEREKAVALVSELMDYPIKYSKRIGKRNILIGLFLGPVSASYMAIRLLARGDKFQDIIQLVIVDAVLGLGLSLFGLFQYLNKQPKLNQKQVRELNTMVYGVEEPKKNVGMPKMQS
jgi:hypothetical protein